MDTEFPKEFLLKPDDFANEVDVLAKKYGYWQWAVIAGSTKDNLTSDFFCANNVQSEGMSNALISFGDDMQERIEEYKKDK